MPLTRRHFLGTTLAATGWGLGAGVLRGAATMSTPDQADLITAADTFIADHVARGHVQSAVLLVRQAGRESVRAYGDAKPQTPFLIASITKPMTAAAVLLLRDRGQVRLADPVAKYLPQFSGGQRDLVTLRHLLTHTSGLPDMLPENEALRKRHAPLADFVAGTCRTDLRFAPGARASYQSMGLLLLGTIAEKVAGRPLPAFLAESIFAPLRMHGASLGLGGRKLEATARCQVTPTTDWDWNSPYWRTLAAPWGGAHATADDLAKFLEYFTASEAGGSLSPATRREMTTIQTAGLNEAWGYGWSREPKKFSSFCSPETFGHSGSTGVTAWHDPAVKLTCVLLTSWPQAESGKALLEPVCDRIARAAHAQPEGAR